MAVRRAATQFYGGVTVFKNIFILGAGRSGKTTLAKMIAKKYGYSIISIDDIVTAMEAFPDLNIAWNGEHGAVAEKMAPFLAMYLQELSEGPVFYGGCKTVIEGTAIDLDRLIPAVNRRKYLLIGLTYCQTTAEELFQNVRKYDTEDDWTYYLTDEQLKSYCEISVERNKYFDEKCKEHRIATYDTSSDREAVFADIVAHLEEQCQWE